MGIELLKNAVLFIFITFICYFREHFFFIPYIFIFRRYELETNAAFLLEINVYNILQQNWYKSTPCNPQLPNCNQAYETFIK